MKDIQKDVDERTMKQKMKDTIKRDSEKVVIDYTKPATITTTKVNHSHGIQDNTNIMKITIVEGM